MNKLVITAFLFAVGGVVWFVFPSDEDAEVSANTQNKSSKAKQGSPVSMDAPSQAMGEFPSDSLSILKRDNPGDQFAEPNDDQPENDEPQDDEYGSAPGYFARSGSTAEAGTENRIPAGSRRRPWPIAKGGDFAVQRTTPSDRPLKPNPLPENDPFPQVHVALLKDSVARYHQRFGENDPIPAEAPIGDVMPAGIVTELGVSPETQLTMLGPFHLDDVRAYQNVSTVSDEHHGLLGVSYVTPDGEAHRKYVRIQANIIDE